jgi:hypothetical protein
LLDALLVERSDAIWHASPGTIVDAAIDQIGE